MLTIINVVVPVTASLATLLSWCGLTSFLISRQGASPASVVSTAVVSLDYYAAQQTELKIPYLYSGANSLCDLWVDERSEQRLGRL